MIMTIMLKHDKTLLLLGILRSHQIHGYELHALLSSPVVPIQIGKANAYQLLNQFEERGWTTAHEENEGNRPPRRVYSLTSIGEEVFEKLLCERLAVHIPTIHADAISLNFLSLLPTAEVVALLSRRLDIMQQRLDELHEQVIDDAETHYGVDYLLKHARFERDWLVELIDKLAAQIQESTAD